MIGESILELRETNATDESIKSCEYNEYQPITGTQLNSAGQITITIENQDQFLHLHNSYLLIEGDVLKADKRWNMLIILVRLHHFLVWRAIEWIIIKGVEMHKVGIQISTLLQPWLILDLVYVNRV